MIKRTYSISIDQPQALVFQTIMDKSVYPDWAKAWGEGMTYEGEWKVGAHISFFDHKRGGTKVVIKELNPPTCIRAKHIAMVSPQNVEIELTDDLMNKWIGTREEYYVRANSETNTTLEVVMEIDEAFQEMFDNAWPKALQYFKEIFETNELHTA